MYIKPVFVLFCGVDLCVPVMFGSGLWYHDDDDLERIKKMKEKPPRFAHFQCFCASNRRMRKNRLLSATHLRPNKPKNTDG
jgi:hypothetical protein